jgi:N-methylhydantoinase A
VARLRVWLDGAWREAPFHERRALRAGHEFAGPAVVTQEDCTTCVPPGFTVRVDEYGSLRIRSAAA